MCCKWPTDLLALFSLALYLSGREGLSSMKPWIWACLMVCTLLFNMLYNKKESS